MKEPILLLDTETLEGKPELLNKANVLIQWEQEPFILIKERTTEELYREFRSKTRFEKDYETFKRLKPKLLMDDRYRGRWVAIVNGKLIGPSDDDSELSRIIDEQYGNVPAYIGRIVKEETVLELPPRELE